MTTRTELLKRAPRTVLPRAGQRVLCAVSGGLDSMCLLHMLEAWCEERGGQAAAAHFNHRLRGAAADRDEEFVRETCARWGIPLAVGREDVRAFAKGEGLSVEEAARNLRYAFLRRTAADRKCKRLYTAHHAGDNAETVLLNLVRGTGLKGLAGMERQRDGICRPLLDVTRAELEDCAAAWEIPHIEDETNTDPDAASRNFLRLRIMPLLEELNPRAAEHISRTAGQLRCIDRTLEEDAAARTAYAEVRNGRVSLSADTLLQAPEAVRPRMLLHMFDLLGVGRRDMGAVHLSAILDLICRPGRKPERRLSLPHSVTARCCRGELVLETQPQAPAEVRLLPGRPLRWGDCTLVLLDRPEGEGLSLRPSPQGQSSAVTVAPAPPGGRLALSGGRGRRSVKRLCLDRRIPPEERDRLPAIYVEGKLAAVWRLGVDAEFLPEGNTVRFIKIIKDREADET